MKLRAVLFSTNTHSANGWVLINIAIKIERKGFKLMVYVLNSSLRTRDTKRNWEFNPACYLRCGTFEQVPIFSSMFQRAPVKSSAVSGEAKTRQIL